MASYIAGSINFQGLGSGTDFSSIISQLKKIESIPIQRMELWKADWQARAEAFETVLQSMRDARSALSLINSRDKFVAKFATSSRPDIASISATGKALDGAHSIEVTQLANNAIWSCGTEFEKKTASIATQNTEFAYTYKGQTRTLQIAGNTSLESFVNIINNDPQNKGIRASIVQSGSTYRLQIQGKDSGADATLDITPSDGSFTFDGWMVQDPKNAKFMLDNWPDELESTSNNISGVLDGVAITVFDLGKAQLSVATDTQSVQQNIQTFLDAVNSVRMSIRELSKVDGSTSGYNFSVAEKTNVRLAEAKKDDNSATKQAGSVLTGNYGVQLLNSRMKDLAAGMPPGFQKILGNDFFSGDLISSLSQIGIKTVSDKDDPHYGLLVVAPPSTASGMQDMDQKAFDEALTNKLDALLDFFACDDEGSSTSADFRYASHVKGGTKAGTYAVNYTVSYDPAAPDVPAIDVYIDGHKAARDSNMEGYWFTSANGPSAGLAIQIDNLNVGEHSGKVSIKQGKIREMEDFFTAETRSYDNYTHTGGALEVLKRNYANIMENIDKKIEREQTRIAQWEQRQKLAYSRLDTLLAKYNLNQQRLEKELAKLNQ
jgi:flagellar hook-associated protein 2